jgi:hypothetical protein
MKTFKRATSESDRCTNCGRPEIEHTWVCDGCGQALFRQPYGYLPILHVSASPEHHPEQSGATLVCVHTNAN